MTARPESRSTLMIALQRRYRITGVIVRRLRRVARPATLRGRTLAISAALIAATSAHAGDSDNIVGPYAGVALGASALHFDDSAATNEDTRGSTFSLYGGYRFTDHLGVEIGYTRIGDASQTFVVDGVSTTHTAKARSMYAAATGRLPLSEHIALNGKLGMAFGDVGSDDPSPDVGKVTGRKRSLMAGLGAEYQPWERVALTVSYDYYGKLSDELSASALTAGVRVSF